jgi:diketogulonate reductase-like aldo/keto reductase
MTPCSREDRRSFARFSRQNFAHSQRIVQQRTELAARHGATSTQLALAWITHQGDEVVTLPGTKQRTYLAEPHRNQPLPDDSPRSLRSPHQQPKADTDKGEPCTSSPEPAAAPAARRHYTC